MFDPTPKRTSQSNLVTVRINESGRDWLKKKAMEHEVTQTEVIKAALSFAASREQDFTKAVEKRKR